MALYFISMPNSIVRALMMVPSLAITRTTEQASAAAARTENSKSASNVVGHLIFSFVLPFFQPFPDASGTMLSASRCRQAGIPRHFWQFRLTAALIPVTGSVKVAVDVPTDVLSVTRQESPWEPLQVFATTAGLP